MESDETICGPPKVVFDLPGIQLYRQQVFEPGMDRPPWIVKPKIHDPALERMRNQLSFRKELLRMMTKKWMGLSYGEQTAFHLARFRSMAAKLS